MAVEMATDAGRTHPTGMPSCLQNKKKQMQNWDIDKKTSVTWIFVSKYPLI